LIRIAIEKFRLGIVDGVLCGWSRVEGYVTNFSDLFIEFSEGPVELVLFAEGVRPNQVEVTSWALAIQSDLLFDGLLSDLEGESDEQSQQPQSRYLHDRLKI